MIEENIKPKLSLDEINQRIKQEICYKTLEELHDEKLMFEYKCCNSVKNEIKKLANVLDIINNQHNQHNSKLLCVICNEIQLKSKKNKTYNLFETGFTNNTLCYLNNLQNIIHSFFL